MSDKPDHPGTYAGDLWPPSFDEATHVWHSGQWHELPLSIEGVMRKMAARIEQLEAEVRTWQGHARTAIWSDSEECKFLTARIEQLEAALRMIRDNEPERLAWSVGYARAALEVHSIGHEDGLRPRERA